MYKDNQDLKYRNKTPVQIVCDHCGSNFHLLFKSAEKNKKKYNGHKCPSCTGHIARPQNMPGYWTEEKKQQHAATMQQSEAYRQAIETRDVAGEKNPMFGKKMSVETRQKMSKSRLGKIGSQATAWKGGKTSVNKRVKHIIHGRYNWYYRVYQRDGWKCVECSGKDKIDAHHIDPMNQIIRRLCAEKHFTDDDEKITWLVEQPEVIDPELKNGITLCRKCHKAKHQKWGSHEAQ